MQTMTQDIEKLERGRSIEAHALLQNLAQWSSTARTNPKGFRPLIRCHFLLNEQCQNELIPAPAFRPKVILKKFEAGSPDEDLYRSMVIVDLHWLLCNGFEPRDQKLKDVFDKGWISTTDADIHNFLAAKRKRNAKVGQLSLPPTLEMECAYLIKEEVDRKRWRIFGVQREQRLKELLLRVEKNRLPSHMSHLKSKSEMCEVLVNVAAAMEVSNLLIGKVTNKETLYWYKRMTGDASFTGLPMSDQVSGNPVECLRRRIRSVRKIWNDVP